MKSKTIFALTSMFLCFGCNSGSSGDSSSKIAEPVKEEVVRQLTPEELKAQLKQKECDEATGYLHGTLKYTPMFKGLLSTKVNGIKMNCTITNSATAATFKNMVAHLSFVSKTDAVVIEKDVEIYEYIQPNGSIVYKGEMECTNQQWNDIANVKWHFKSAECQ